MRVSALGAGARRGSAARFAMTLLLVLSSVALTACGGADGSAAGDPVGETFPTVTGDSLAKASVTLPDDYAGAPAIVLVAPSKESQSDADEWIEAPRPKKDVVFVETPVARLTSSTTCVCGTPRAWSSRRG